MKKPVDKVCEHCKKKFKSFRRDRQYCSSYCRTLAWNAKHPRTYPERATENVAR
jgi:hypothetical protein